MADTLDTLQIQVESNAQSAYSGIENLSKALDGLSASLSSINTSKLDAFTSSIARFGTAVSQLSSVGQVASSIQMLKTSVDSLNGIKVDPAGFDSIVSSISKLGNKKMSSAVTAIPFLEQSISSLVSTLNGLQGIQFDTAGITNLLKAIGALGNNKVGAAVSSLPALTQGLNDLVVSLNGLQGINFDVSGLTKLGEALRIIGSKNAQTAASGLDQLGDAMKRLMTSLASAPQVSQNVIQMTQAMAQLASQGSKMATATTAMAPTLPKLSIGLQSTRKHAFNLAAAFGKLYASYWLILRAIRGVKGWVDLASSLTEIQNVIDHTFGNTQGILHNFASTAIQSFGLSELSAKRFASRYQSMGIAMGITSGQVKQANDSLIKMGKTVYNTNGSLADMSVNLTKLVADYASFYDQDQAKVAEKFNAVLTGMTRPLREYGIDLSQNTIKEWAMRNGINANISAMTQAEKTMLRYQYVMANSQHIMGDFARTSDTWHNQMVQLAQSFQAFGSIVGGAIVNAMKPFIRALNAGMQAAIKFATVVSDALGFIFGWKYEAGGGGISELPEVFDDAAGGAGGMADGTGKAADNAKKLKNYLMGIDELNVLEPPKDDAGSGGGGGGGGGGGADGSGAGDGGQWVKADNALKNYLSDIDSLFKLGDTIADMIAKSLGDIKWENVFARARDFGTGLAHFLNGLIKPELFSELGKTIANSINTALYALNSFGKTFNWHNFGVSIAEGLNSFFRSFKPQLAADTFNTFVKGILETMSTAIRMTDWWQVGNTIGQALAGIDWIGIFSAVKEVIGSAITAMFTTAAGLFDASPGFAIIATAIGTGFAALKTIQAVQGFSSFISGIAGSIKALGRTIEGTFGVGSIPIVGAVAGLGLLVTYLEASSTAAAQHSAYGEYAREVEKLSNQIDRNNESIQGSIKYMREHVGEAGIAELALARDLATEYEALQSKLNPTVADQLRMKEISEQLVAVFPELKDHINEENGLLSVQKGELDELISKTDAYYRLQAGREVLLQAYKTQIEAEQNLKMAQEGATSAVEDYLRETGLTEAAIHQLVTREKDHWKLMKEFEDSPLDFEKMYGVKNLATLEKSYGLVDEAQKKYAASLEEAQGTYEKATDNLNYIKEAVNGYADEVNAIEYSQLIVTTSAAIDELGGIWSGGKQVLGQEAINIYDEIQKGLNPTEDGYYKLGNGQIVQFGKGMGDAAPTAVKTLDDALVKQVNSVLEPNGKILLVKDGEYIVQGLADSIEDNTSKVEAPMKGLGDLLKSTYESELQINSPSKVFWNYGQLTVQGLANGISENINLVENPILNWVKSIFTWFTGDGGGDDKVNASAFETIARNIIPGFSSGIEGSQGESQSPIEAWATNIIQWFTKGDADGGINGTTWTNYAKNVASSFGSGITAHSGESQAGIEQWASNIKTWFWGSSDQGPGTGLAAKFMDFGKWMMQGFLNGVNALRNEFNNVISGLSQDAQKITEAKNKIASPSKVYYAYGEYIVEGFANGIKDNADEVANAVASMSEDAQGNVKTGTIQFGDAKSTTTAVEGGILTPLANTLSTQNVAAATQNIPSGVKNSWDSTRAQWNHDMEHWWQYNVEPYFTYGRWQDTTSSIQTSIAFNTRAMIEEWRKNMSNWWSTLVAPYFVYERWLEQAQRIYDSIITVQTNMMDKWRANMNQWWDRDVAPFFTLDRWKEQAQRIFDSIIAAQTAMRTAWNKGMSEWWTLEVAPWFDRKKWDGVTQTIPDSFISAISSAVDDAMDILDEFFEEVEDRISDLRSELESLRDAIRSASRGGGGGGIDVDVDVEFDAGDDWEDYLDEDRWDSDFSDSGPGFFASGGFPKKSQLFWARENGIPEMVGKFGHQTGVANNMQIVDGIASGVSGALGGLVSAIKDLAISREPSMPSFSGRAFSGFNGEYGMTDADKTAYAQQMAQAIVMAQNNGDDNRLMRQQNELLEEILAKDNNVYLDGQSVNRQTDQARRRAGFNFRVSTT